MSPLSFDVLYCLEDDVERRAIAEMHRVLRRGGALIVNAAALDMLKGEHSILVAEVRRYTRRSLRSKLEAGGFHIERITYTNASTFPVAAAGSRIAAAWRRSSTTAIVEILPCRRRRSTPRSRVRWRLRRRWWRSA